MSEGPASCPTVDPDLQLALFAAVAVIYEVCAKRGMRPFSEEDIDYVSQWMREHAPDEPRLDSIRRALKRTRDKRENGR